MRCGGAPRVPSHFPPLPLPPPPPFAASPQGGIRAIELDQDLPRRIIPPVELSRGFEFLARFLRQPYGRKPARMIGFFSVRSAYPLVVDRIPRVDGYGFLRTPDCRV